MINQRNPETTHGLMPDSVRRFFAVLGCAATLVILAASASSGQDLKGAGSTFVAPVMAVWIDHYKALSHATIAYQGVGSGAGIKAVEAGTVDFGATEKPLDPKELAKFHLCQFPIIIGGIVPVVNLPDIALGQIRFPGRILADIFMGKITRWDDPDIAGANPSLSLPDLPITVVYRSDSSGTTYNFSNFLSLSNDEWRKRYGTAMTLNVPTGAARQGNAGIAAAVQQTQGAIGYVEYTFALKNYLTYGSVANPFGRYVPASADSFQAAASAVDWRRHQDFNVLMTNAPSPDAYPITASTFILLPETPVNPARSGTALSFFKWVLEHGGPDAIGLRYAPIPGDVSAMIEGYWATHITTSAAMVTKAHKTVAPSH
jgi:phosphate transport system substrate-binding protein